MFSPFYFEEVRKLPWEKVLKKFGLAFKEKKHEKVAAMMRCVFHKEKHASLAFFRDGSFYCYGCAEIGSMFDFVRHRLKTSRQITAVFFRREFLIPLPNDKIYLEIARTEKVWQANNQPTEKKEKHHSKKHQPSNDNCDDVPF